jgi:hypothetical protein
VLKESKEKAVNDVKKQTKFYQSIAPKASGVPVVIRSFKSVCTKHINEIFPHWVLLGKNVIGNILLKT